MEKEIRFKKLSKGLGFYNKYSSLNDLRNKSFQKTLSVPSIPDFLLQQPLDLKDEHTYEYLLDKLQQPWLGEKVGTKKGSSGFSKETLPRGKVTVSSDSEEEDSKLKDELSSRKESSANSKNLSEVTPSEVQKISSEQVISSQSTVSFTECVSLKSYLVDSCFMVILFFSPLYLCAALTQPQPIKSLLAVWPYILICFLIFSQMYCFICRLFCLDTYGEMLSKRRLLYNQQPPHPLRLLWRFLVSCLTGVITLPVLTMIFKKDFSAYLTGLHFQKVSDEV